MTKIQQFLRIPIPHLGYFFSLEKVYANKNPMREAWDFYYYGVYESLV
jgi:hypothetical protein